MPQKKISIFEIENFSFGKKFSLLGRLYLNALSKELKHLNIEGNFSVLVLIDKMGDQCSQKFLADKLHVDKTMMVGVLDDLSKKGFIKRMQNPSDRREYWIQLTPKGKKSVPQILDVVDCLNKSLVKNLKIAEVKQFNKHLELIYKRLIDINKC
jgi:MarR family transcriptional regulator for hemolysin